ncbi:MAG TPA: caspase family protein [Conexibacter sp.]|nr:caspase family protein [Conexibacter sp.]
MTLPGSRHALVIAGSRYTDPRLRELRSPAVDAARLAAVLADPDIGAFAVETAIDEHDGELRRRIARFFSDRRSDDLLLLHISCHGVQDENGELHLATTNTETGLLSATSLPAAWISQQIERSYSKKIVMLLDCCFSGAFPFGVRARAGDDVPVKRHLGGRGRVVITASSAMEYAWEGDRLSGAPRPSIFTEAILDGLETGAADRNGDGLVSVDELYDYVFDSVQQRTPHQRPQMMSDIEGTLQIARRARSRSSWTPPADEPPPEPPPPEPPPPERPPEQVQRSRPHWRDRAVAALIDAPLALLVGSVAAFVVAVPLTVVATPSTVGVIFFLTVLPLGGGTYAALLAVLLHRDRTLGQQARSLRVLAADRDEAPELWRRALREALKWTSLWLWGFASFLLYALVFRRVRRYLRDLGSKDPYYDRMAGTRLVQETVPASGAGR